MPTHNICVSCSLFVAQITETVTRLSFILVSPIISIENTRDCSDCAWNMAAIRSRLFLPIFIRSTLQLYTRVGYVVGTCVVTSCY